MVWPPGLRDAWTKYTPPAWIKNQLGPKHLGERWGLDGPLLERLSAKKESESARAKTTATFSAAVTARLRRHFTGYGAHLRTLPPHVAEMLIRAYGSQRWFGETEVFRVYAAEHGEMFLEAFLAYASAHLEDGLPLLLPYRDPRIAPLAADALHRLKKKPPAARGWLLAHPEAAALGLVPAAVGKLGKSRDAAGAALRFLAREGHQDVVLAVARRYGGPAETAVREVFAFDPMAHVPSKMPALPDFARVDVLPRLVLRGEGGTEGASLPLDAMKHVLSMLQISTLDDPYAGVAALVELTTPSSRGELAWELFQSWSVSGASPKEAWAFAAMGFFGDDECARRLTPLVRAWPGQSQHQRAVIGLEVLARIGTDVALMHLNGIAQKLKFKGLQEKAREKIEQIAEARGFTAEELADRLVPDLGLDDDGSLTLSFGARSFRVSFDESLEPFVRDETNAVVGELPKPRKDDDATKAAAATETWKTLKKDAKTIAQQQVTRLELSMCARRRWSEDVFRRFLVEHPLVRHLVLRLAWGAYDGKGALVSVFRVAEDGTYADVNDEAFTLGEGLAIGVAHTLEMKPDDQARMGQLFGDYELLQPFVQLGRESYALTAEEKKLGIAQRWKGSKVPTGKVLGLEARGWRRGTPQDGGHIPWMEKQVGVHLVTLDLDPGIAVAALDEFPEQELVGLGVGDDWRWRKEKKRSLAELDDIIVSELLRDVTSIAG